MLSLSQVYRRVPDIKVFLCREMHRSYYDALGLTPKASQGDIKKAYYKMSMVYHPDKGADNSVKFQEISTAYEVLGNNKLRKLYDRGLLPPGVTATDHTEVYENPAAASQASGQNKTQKERVHENFYENVNAANFGDAEKSKGPYTGKTKHYDFDAWTQAHYSETFAKQEYRKAEKERRKKRKQTAIEKFQRMEQIATTIFLVLVVASIYSATTIFNHDQVYYKRKDK